MILVIDNYDSFVHNLARYLRELGHETEVVRNDAIDARRRRASRPVARRHLAGAVHAERGRRSR